MIQSPTTEGMFARKGIGAPVWKYYHLARHHDSLVMWASTFMGVFNMAAAGIVLFIGSLAGLPILVVNYNRIYKKYKKK